MGRRCQDGTNKPKDISNLERAYRNKNINCTYKMTVSQAKEGQRECKKVKGTIKPNPPHLREGHLIERHVRAIKKKQFGKAKIIKKMMVKEHTRQQ